MTASPRDTGAPAPGSDSIRLLSLPEACQMLGCSLRTGYTLIERGEFPVSLRKIGNRWKVSRVELERWISEPTPANGSDSNAVGHAQ